MRVLFLGGTGTISSACSRLALARGIELYLFNRGKSARPIPEGAHVLHGDVRDRRSVENLLGDTTFDVVVNEDICIGCDLCLQMCKFDALQRRDG